jgi:8-oxo-dGTP pyrophosphatase MutT (NUDIX family)
MPYGQDRIHFTQPPVPQTLVCGGGRLGPCVDLCYGRNVPPQNPWTTLKSRIAYANQWVRVREDEVLRPDGKPGLYGVIEIRPSVGVLALNDRDEIALVGQWRYPLNRYGWEIVRGGSDEGDTDMLEAARRELREETGYDAAGWDPLGPVDVNNGVTTDVQHLFIARELTYCGVHLDPVEDIQTRWVSFDDAVRMALDGGITEVCSVAGILRYQLRRHSGTLAIS